MLCQHRRANSLQIARAAAAKLSGCVVTLSGCVVTKDIGLLLTETGGAQAAAVALGRAPIPHMQLRKHA
jgi:hypothetical protein